MKLQAIALLASLALAQANLNPHGWRAQHLNRRQDAPPVDPSTTTPAPPAETPLPTSDSTQPPAGQPTPTPTTTTPAPAESCVPPGGTGVGPPCAESPGTPTTTTDEIVTTTALAEGTSVAPLDQISSAMATRAGLLPTNLYTAGATPPVSGAPPLPTPFVFQQAEWPVWDRVPPTDSPEVREWMKELDGYTIPNLNPTVDGSCGGDPAAAADAANRGWWTCGGHVRSTDVVACPDKGTWGVSFDDGPSPFTQYLLNYLEEMDLSATFFVVGSRVVERPTVLVEEYMKGHEISVHTWSHRPLTSLTNEQVVAELGWTRKAIKDVIGVTPTTMRPPFGDIDDRVRAISMAMGMIPIMWSRTPSGGVFDTNDWRVAAGHVKGPESFETFQTILNNASAMETGFIVLQHDLYESTVSLGVGYTIPYALEFQPPLTLQPIGQCIKKPTTDLYLESNTNTTFPIVNRDRGVDTDGDGQTDVVSGDRGTTAPSSGGSRGGGGNGAVSISVSLAASLLAVGAAVSAGLV